MANNDPDVLFSAGFDQSGFDEELNKLQTKIVNLQLEIIATNDKIAAAGAAVREKESAEEKAAFDEYVDLLRQKVVLKKEALNNELLAQKNYAETKRQLLQDEEIENLKTTERQLEARMAASARELEAAKRTEYANQESARTSQALIEKQLAAATAATDAAIRESERQFEARKSAAARELKVAQDSLFAQQESVRSSQAIIEREVERSTASRTKVEVAAAKQIADEEARAAKFESDEEYRILQEKLARKKVIASEGLAAAKAALFAEQEAVRSTEAAIEKELARAAAALARNPLNSQPQPLTPSQPGQPAPGLLQLFGGSLPPFGTSVAAFGYGIRNAAQGIPGLRALSSIGIAGGFGGPAGIAGAAAGVGIAETIRLVMELTTQYENLAKKAYELAQNHYYLQGVLAKTSDTVESSFYPVLQKIQGLETELADWADTHQDKIEGIVNAVTRLTNAGQGLVENIVLFLTKSKTLNEALTVVADKLTAIANATAKLFETVGKGDFSYLLSMIQVATTPSSLIGMIGGMVTGPSLNSGWTTSVGHTVNPITPFTDAEQEAIGRDKSVKSKKEEITALEKQYVLEQQLRTIQQQYNSGDATKLDYLVSRKAIDEKIIELQLKAKQNNEAEARYQLSLGGTLEEKKQKTLAVLSAEQATLEVKDKLLKKTQEADDAINKEIELEAKNAETFRVKLDTAREQLGIKEEQLRITQEESTTLSDLAKKHQEIVILQLSLSQMKKGDFGYYEAELDILTKELDLKKEEVELRIKASADELAKAQAMSSGKLNELNDVWGDPIKSVTADAAYTEALEKEERARQRLNKTTIDGNTEIQQGQAKIAQMGRSELENLLARQAALKQLIDTQRGDTLTQQIVGIYKQGTNPVTGEIDPQVQTAVETVRLQHAGKILELQAKAADESKKDLQVQLSMTTNAAKRKELQQDILDAKAKESSLNEDILANLLTQQQSIDPTSEAWFKLDEEIAAVMKRISGLEPVTKTWGQMFANTMQSLGSHLSEFKSSLGAVATDLGGVIRSVEAIGKVETTDAAGKAAGAAGSIAGGIGAIFSSGKSFFTQGIPIFGAIASSVLGLAGAVAGLFTAAAKKMAAEIDTQVKAIVSATDQAGTYAAGIMQLQAQYNQAVSSLSGKKGGQKQLDTLLPVITQQIEALQAKQKEIVDSFNKALNDLKLNLSNVNLGKTFDALYNSVAAAEKAVNDFLNATGKTPEAMQKVQDFLNATAQQMSQDWQDAWTKEWNAWVLGAENAAGELISIDQKALDEIDAENQNFIDAETQRQKSLANLNANEAASEAQYYKDKAKLEADFTEQQEANLKQLAALQTSINSLNAKEITDIQAIQNQGIATRMQTTQQSKAQQIADLQDQNALTRAGLAQQITDLQAAMQKQAAAFAESMNQLNLTRQANYAAFLEQLEQMGKAEALAQLNHSNTLSRIALETERQRQQHLANMANLQAEQTFIQQMTESLKNFAIGGPGLQIGSVIVSVNNSNASPVEIANAVTTALNNLAKGQPTLLPN